MPVLEAAWDVLPTSPAAGRSSWPAATGLCMPLDNARPRFRAQVSPIAQRSGRFVYFTLVRVAHFSHHPVEFGVLGICATSFVVWEMKGLLHQILAEVLIRPWFRTRWKLMLRLWRDSEESWEPWESEEARGFLDFVSRRPHVVVFPLLAYAYCRREVRVRCVKVFELGAHCRCSMWRVGHLAVVGLVAGLEVFDTFIEPRIWRNRMKQNGSGDDILAAWVDG